jgi:hypothetical protein
VVLFDRPGEILYGPCKSSSLTGAVILMCRRYGKCTDTRAASVSSFARYHVGFIRQYRATSTLKAWFSKTILQ